MDDKRRSKRKSMDDGYWDCSVCTYRNTPEAFKCEMCDVRKGTSTRKPRLNPQMVAQQVAQQFPPQPKKEKSMHKKDKDLKERDNKDSKEKEIQYDNSREETDIELEMKDNEKDVGASTSHSGTNNKKPTRPPRLKNIDRSSGTSMEVTVGDLTVIITDYKPKKDKGSSPSLIMPQKKDIGNEQGIHRESLSPTLQHCPNSGLLPTEIKTDNPNELELNGDLDMDEKTI